MTKYKPYTIKAIKTKDNDYTFTIITTDYIYEKGERLPCDFHNQGITLNGQGYTAYMMKNTMKSININVPVKAKAADIRELWNTRMVPILQRAINELE